MLLATVSLGAQIVVPMQNGKVRVCRGTFTDSDLGKTTKYYEHNENYTLTLSVPGASGITLKFTSFCTEKDNDIIRIFDGKDTFATLLGSWSGNKGPGTIKSKDSFITIHFISDKSVACTGWEATISTQIIPPPTPKITVFQSAKCNENAVIVTSDIAIPCDSLKASNTSITGPFSIAASGITALNCTNGKATRFRIDLNTKLSLNGLYAFTIVSFVKDFCDSVYKLTSKFNVSVSDCPLKVILTADNDTICKGSCTYLRVAVSGGNPSKYVYSWTPTGLSGAGPIRVCPSVNTRYILRVTDGLSIPSSDTLDIVVLDPPAAMKDTDVCYYSSNLFLKATPAGGKWMGKGIINASTGEFKPLGNYGANKVWYQIGSCADTVIVTSTLPWNLENVFCPGTSPRALWWYGPAGGSWSGPKVNSAGIFNPDVPGTYKDTYTWKGCISVKTVYVEDIVVPRYDTTCESINNDTLSFSPKGIYPTYFVGLTNSYYGWYNPSAMGGPQTKMIVWNGGGCLDTTYLTVLASDAGVNDTFCPDAGKQTLKNFRPTSGYTWTGKGIVNPYTAEYDPSFFAALGKPSYRDTLTIKAGKCVDKKYVYLYPTEIGKKDTVFVCYETPAVNLSNLPIGISPKGGKWFGPGVGNSVWFTPSAAGYGSHSVIYDKNGCQDTLVLFVRPKPIVQKDTNVCIASAAFQCFAKDIGGSFAGPGITNAVLGTFNPSLAGVGVKTIRYTSKNGCLAFFNITVDSIPKVVILNVITDFCFKDTTITLLSNISGGTFSGAGVVGSTFNPSRAGSGKHSITYTLKSGTCIGNATIDFIVGDTLIVQANPVRDTICPGEIVWLRSKGKGGDAGNYSYVWDNGQTGSGTFVSPKSSANYTVTLTDGCSDASTATVIITKHNQPYFNAVTSAPKCFGLQGYAKVRMKDADSYSFQWDLTPPFYGDSLVAQVGNTYRLTAKNLRTGCQADTVIEIPGYKSITAGFIANIQGGDRCVTNIFPELRVFNNGIGATSGTWYWGDGSSEAFDPNTNPTHTYNGEKEQYTIKLVVYNAGGCKDSTETSICFKDTVLVFIPSAFTPDGNNKNEIFLPIANGAVRYEFIVYNRWGQIVFRTEDAKQGWNGDYKGLPCPEGVYSYQLIYKGRKSMPQQQRGSIVLMRID
jgi:gliding motility-associated-like protein